MFDFVRKMCQTFGYARAGIAILLFKEKHSLILLLGGIAGLLLAWLLKVNKIEWMFVILGIVLIYVAEALNTAIEQVVDMVSPEYHPMAKKAKDVAAGAVLIAVIMAALIATLVFGPKIAALL